MSDHESGFHEIVQRELESEFRHVIHEPYLPSTGRRPDFWVQTRFDDYIIEVENAKWEDVRMGVGQALEYSGTVSTAKPVVIFPEEAIVQPEYDNLRSARHDVLLVPMKYESE